MLTYFPELICLLGLLLWFLMTQAKGVSATPPAGFFGEVGRLMFFAGLLALCLRGFTRP